MIHQLKELDGYMYGIRTYIFVYFSQLNPKLQALKVSYSESYYVLSYWHLLDVGEEAETKLENNPWAAVNVRPEGIKIT